jgi:hypothetical protein
LITAAIMVVITFLPVIIHAVRAWLTNAGRVFRPGYHQANRTVTNQLYKKLLEKLGPNPSDAAKRLFLQGFPRWRLILEQAGGIVQKMLYGWFTNPKVFWQWLGPLGQVGLFLVPSVAALLVWVYRDDLKLLYDHWTGKLEEDE